MYDPWVTREMTIRDLLVHRSGLGLGAGDLLFVPRTSLSRAEAVKRLRYIKPATSFRSGYAYDNILYMVAGQMIEAMTGETWEKFTAEHVLKPAGMLNSTSDEDKRFATANRAYPHARMNGGLRGAGTQEVLDERDELGRNAAPAGGLAISANDFARWLRIQLGGGKLVDSDAHLFSTAARDEMWTPRTIMPISPRPGPIAATTPNFDLYALGWDVRDYRGVKLISHGGAVFGFQTFVALIPDKHVGFSMTINSEDGEIIVGLAFELLDHYLDAPAQGWPEKFIAFKKSRIAAGLEAYKAKAAKPAKVGPSLALKNYVGTFSDPWYGNIEVALNKAGKLTIDFKSTPNMGGTLEHWQYDSFTTKFNDKNIEPAYVNFAPRRRRQGREDHDEAGLAARRFQLRLPGPAVHAGGGEAISLSFAPQVPPFEPALGRSKGRVLAGRRTLGGLCPVWAFADQGASPAVVRLDLGTIDIPG